MNENAEEELLAVLSHEIGHLKHKKNLLNILWYAILAGVFFAAVWLIYRPDLILGMNAWIRSSFDITVSNMYVWVSAVVSILTPLCMPALATLFLQSFIAQWNAYLWPLLVTNTNAMRTVQVGITMLTTIEGTNYEVVLAASAVAMVPAAVLFLALRRQITRSLSGGALVG